MSIIQDLEQILSARYGRDVRQAIHDSIEEGYNIAVQAEGKATTAQDSASASASASAQSSASALQSAQLAEQYKNEAFSGTPTGYEALVEKVNSIYKETASHYAIVGSSEGSALAHTIYGMSKQDGVPTPDNPVEIQSAIANYKCEGKNLITFPYYQGDGATSFGITYTVKNDGTIIANGTATGQAGSMFSITAYIAYPPKPNYPTNKIIKSNGRKFRLSGCPSGGGNNIYYLQCAGGTATTPQWYGNNIDTGNGAVFNANINNYYFYIFNIRIFIATGYTANNLVFKPMLTVWGDSEEYQPDQTYEPYKATEVTTDLTLRAIEVTSSDDYNLVKDGKYYIADTVDWDEDKGYVITRRVGTRDITAIGSVGKSSPVFGIISKQLFDSDDFIVTSTDNDIILAYCNRFKPTTYNGFQQNDGSLWWNFTADRLYLRNDAMASLADWNTWIANNPVKVYGVLKTPTTEPITSQQAQALLSLKTYGEATSITAKSDVEPTMALEYSKDRNTALALTGHNVAYKNALKIAELNTAFMEITAEQEEA